MQRPTARAWMIAGIVAAVAAGLYYGLRPRPVGVDTARVEVGPMRVAVEEEGKTRVRQVFTVSAPVAGQLLRISLEPGDEVVKDKTVVAVIQPLAPTFLDHRARHEAEAQVAAAEAAVQLSEAEVRQAASELEFAQAELRRSEALARTQTVSERGLQKARSDAEVRLAALNKAKANVDVRRRELESARARLIGPETLAAHPDLLTSCCIQVRSPVDGRLLKRIQSSETPVAPGTTLVEIGDVADIEIVVELLSTEAVKVVEGAVATIDGWGGTQALSARVKRIEPSGFTKVSALGIEEQRVRTILDFDAPLEVRRRLGHDYRVFVRITTWSADRVLRAPLSALFRSGENWAVFRVEAGRARSTSIVIGHRNNESAEVVTGLQPGQEILLHPSDRVREGVRVERRSSP